MLVLLSSVRCYPGRFQYNSNQAIFKLLSVIEVWGIPCDFGLKALSLDVTDKTTLVHVIVVDLIWLQRLFLLFCYYMTVCNYTAVESWISISYVEKWQLYPRLSDSSRSIFLQSLKYQVISVSSHESNGVADHRHIDYLFISLFSPIYIVLFCVYLY